MQTETFPRPQPGQTQTERNHSWETKRHLGDNPGPGCSEHLEKDTKQGRTGNAFKSAPIAQREVESLAAQDSIMYQDKETCEGGYHCGVVMPGWQFQRSEVESYKQCRKKAREEVSASENPSHRGARTV